MMWKTVNSIAVGSPMVIEQRGASAFSTLRRAYGESIDIAGTASRYYWPAQCLPPDGPGSG